MSRNLVNYKQDLTIIHQYLSIALGGNSYLHPFIDKYYQQNEWGYYEAYKRSALRGNQLFSMYTTKSEEKIRKVAGIVEWCYTTQQYTELDKLIKKGYKLVHQYIQQHAHIDFEHFMRSFAKKKSRKGVKELDLIYQNIVLWYLCIRENKPFNSQNVAWKSFQDVLFTSMNEIQTQQSIFSNEMFDKHKEEIDQLYEEYNIPKNLQYDSLGFFLEYLISNHLKKIYETVPNCDAEKAENLVFQESPAKYIAAIGGWLKTLNIHELDATEQIPFSKEDLDMVFMKLLHAQKYKYISNDERDFYFIACLYIKCIGSLFLETKQLYLDNSKEDFYVEMKSKESQIRAKEVELFQKEAEWKRINKKQRDENERLAKELREAQATIRQLEQKMKNLEDYSVEVNALRNFIYQDEHNEYDFDKAPSFESMVEYIQSKRVVIFGGYPGWRQKLKEALPSIEFVDVDELNRDISKIQRVDAIFINTTVFSHAFYRKIMKEIGKKETNTPLFYLNGQSNIEKSILEIYDWLNE